VWAGGTGYEPEERLPFSPVVGLRLERAAFRGIRLGAELATVIMNQRSDCIPLGCEDSVDITVSPIVSGLVRLEVGGGWIRPYVGGSLGLGIARMSIISGVAGGVRLPSALFGAGVTLEAGRRFNDGFDDEGEGRWEVLVGVTVG
jgi:hypothetical protein